MTKEEIEARIEAIEYLLDNKLYSVEMASEMYREIEMLKDRLEEPETTPDKSVNNILEQRKNQYGDYSVFVDHMSKVMNILSVHKGGEGINIYTVEDIENFFFVLKLLRLQTATDIDSLIDLSNYAKLAKDRRNAKNNS